MILGSVPSDDLNADVQHILSAFNHRIAVVDNLQVKIIGVTAPATPDTEFSVTHGLGKIPTGYIWNVDRAAIVYDSNKSSWTDSAMTLKCNVASAVITLVVFV